jgi:hypothetical protein
MSDGDLRNVALAQGYTGAVTTAVGCMSGWLAWRWVMGIGL